MATFNGTSGDDFIPELLLGPVFALGDDTINGLAGNDTLVGWTGDDILNGGTGADTLIGGIINLAGTIGTIAVTGLDTATYEGSAAGVQIDLSTVNDFVLGIGGITLALTGTSVGHGGDAEGDLLAGIANLIGSAQGDQLTGNDLDNNIQGGAGNDILFGHLGNDTLVGGTGNDTYLIDSLGDTLVEAAGGGRDLVNSTISFTLPSEIEDLTLLGSANLNGAGNGLANTITGNEGNNDLFGLDGNDRLIAGAGNDALAGGAGDDKLVGGTGADAMAGGTGNDLYGVDNAGDLVSELAGEGRDEVTSSIDYSLGDNLEDLTLSGLAVHGLGNDLANTINGNDQDNIINGLGGDDLLLGRDGNDVVAGSSGADRLFGGNNNDRLLGGDDNDELNGDAGDDELNGGAGADTLIGGDGADLMAGDTGDDIYAVSDAGDEVVEFADAGRDRVNSSIDYTLGANVEVLSLTGIASHGLGNELDNSISGNDHDNVLNGADGDDSLVGRGGNDDLAGSGGDDEVYGGDGNDRLFGSDGNDYLVGGNGNDRYTGGDGADIFGFEALGTGTDLIYDFEDGIDLIELNRAGFGIDAGPVNVVSAATSAGIVGDAIFYETTSGSIFWHDGGTVTDTIIVSLANLPAALDATDFVLV